MKIIHTIFLIAMVAAEPTALNPKSFSLSIDMTSLADAVTELDAALASRRRTVTQVVENANQTHPDVCNNTLAYKPLTDKSGSEAFGFCWSDEEERAQYWFPQGVTTTHDAYGDGEYEGHQLVVTSWYHIPEKEAPDAPLKGVRITFTRWEDELPKTYQHVLLVEPTADGDFKIIPIHAGGVMWYGNLLYVAHTWTGFRLFDMDYLYEMDTDRDDLIGKQADGKFYAYGYRYILVQTGRLRNTGSPLRYSFVSLDRATTPDSLITGEYSLGTAKDNNTNVVRFPLDYTTRLPMESANTKVYATEAYETHIYQMQGALARDGRFWFSSSNGAGGPSARSYGRLRVWDRGTTEVRKYTWTYGSEDLAYWKNGDGSGRIWTVTEWPRWRTVVSIPEAGWE